MDDFVTVLTVSYPQQLWIIKSRLEAEGIVCFAKDELTVQSNNLWSNAVGGVKLQVQREDVDRALEILTELGYRKEESGESEDLLTRIDKRTLSIPLLGILKVTTRIYTVAIIATVLITAISYIIIKPSKENVLTSKMWLLDNIYYNNKPIIVDSLAEAPVSFSDNNSILFEGVNRKMISGKWKINGDVMELHSDTLMNILNGSYKIDMSERELTLKSATTTIVAHRN